MKTFIIFAFFGLVLTGCGQAVDATNEQARDSEPLLQPAQSPAPQSDAQTPPSSIQGSNAPGAPGFVANEDNGGGSPQPQLPTTATSSR
jgi:hypothetical protein